MARARRTHYNTRWESGKYGRSRHGRARWIYQSSRDRKRRRHHRIVDRYQSGQANIFDMWYISKHYGIGWNEEIPGSRSSSVRSGYNDLYNNPEYVRTMQQYYYRQNRNPQEED